MSLYVGGTGSNPYSPQKPEKPNKNEQLGKETSNRAGILQSFAKSTKKAGLGMLAVGGALFANDITVVGVADDPVAAGSVILGAVALGLGWLLANCGILPETGKPLGVEDEGKEAMNPDGDYIDPITGGQGFGLQTIETLGGEIFPGVLSFKYADSGPLSREDKVAFRFYTVNEKIPSSLELGEEYNACFAGGKQGMYLISDLNYCTDPMIPQPESIPISVTGYHMVCVDPYGNEMEFTNPPQEPVSLGDVYHDENGEERVSGGKVVLEVPSECINQDGTLVVKEIQVYYEMNATNISFEEEVEYAVNIAGEVVTPRR